MNKPTTIAARAIVIVALLVLLEPNLDVSEKNIIILRSDSIQITLSETAFQESTSSPKAAMIGDSVEPLLQGAVGIAVSGIAAGSTKVGDN
jgi:hypothetical protein